MTGMVVSVSTLLCTVVITWDDTNWSIVLLSVYSLCVIPLAIADSAAPVVAVNDETHQRSRAKTPVSCSSLHSLYLL